MPANPLPKQVLIQKYGRHHWAVYTDSKLLAVTVYKKGASAVKELLEKIVTHAASSQSYYCSDAPDERPNRD